MNRVQRKTLEAVFQKPTLASIKWADVVSMMLALGAEMKESGGSPVRFSIGERRIILHRPHPRKELDKGAIKSLRTFLEQVGIRP